jgi:hypothetical protein
MFIFLYQTACSRVNLGSASDVYSIDETNGCTVLPRRRLL